MRTVTWETFLSGINNKNKRVLIFPRGTLNTPENSKNYEINENTMPRTERHLPSRGPKASVNPKMLQKLRP